MSHHDGQWETRVTGVIACKMCGSLSPAEALRRMTTPGCTFSGTDKGAYKFYFYDQDGGFGKFYGEHLADLTEEELKVWAEASRRCLGVDWVFQSGRAPQAWMPATDDFYGWQTSGKIGVDGKPIFNEFSPIPPDEGWWERQRAKRT